MRHIGALFGFTILVFGTIFLFTSDWLFNAGEQAPTAGQATMPAPQDVADTDPPADTGTAEPQTADAEESAVAAPEEALAGADAAAPEEGQGEPATGEASATAGAAAADPEALMAQGEEQYAQMCQACHGPSGEGAVGPALAENAGLEDVAFVVETILHGRELMPPFGDQLDDEAVAGVATYIRNSWGNAFGAVPPEDVTPLRDAAPATGDAGEANPSQ